MYYSGPLTEMHCYSDSPTEDQLFQTHSHRDQLLCHPNTTRYHSSPIRETQCYSNAHWGHISTLSLTAQALSATTHNGRSSREAPTYLAVRHVRMGEKKRTWTTSRKGVECGRLNMYNGKIRDELYNMWSNVQFCTWILKPHFNYYTLRHATQKQCARMCSLQNLLSHILPHKQCTSHMHIEGTDNSLLRNLYTNIQKWYEIWWDTFLLIAGKNNRNHIRIKNGILFEKFRVLILYYGLWE